MTAGSDESSDLKAELNALRLELAQCRLELESLRHSEHLLRRLISVRSELSRALSKAAPLANILQECSAAIVHHLDAAFARIWTLNHQENVLELQASSGAYTRLDGEYSRIPVGDLKVGWIAREKKPHLTNSVLIDPRVSNKEWARACGFVSFAGYPLIVEGQVVGVMAMFARHALCDATLEALAAIADALAQGIERKRAEEELGAAKARFEGILEIAADAIISVNSSGEIVFFNRGAATIFGYSQSEAVGKPLDLLLPHPAAFARPGHREAFGNSLKGSGTVGPRSELLGIRKDGTEFPVDASVSNLSVAGQRHFTVILRDITERKRAETALRKSENQFRTIVDTIPGMICTLNPAGQVELLSHQVLEYFGQTIEKLKNWAMTDAVHPDDRPWVIEQWKRSIESGEPFDSEQRQRRADGVYRWQQSRALPARDDQGKITGWYMLITDIDDRRRAEQALQRSQAYLTEAQQLSRTGSFGWKPASGELIWSAETFRITGCDPASRPTLEKVFDRIHPEDIELVRKSMEAALRDLSAFEFEHRLLLPNGMVKQVQVVARASTDQTGLTEYVGAVMDITERQQAKANLERALARLAKSESEFRAILNAMPTQVWCALPDGSTEFHNQRWLDYAGLAPEQASGWGWRNALHPDDVEPCVQRWMQIKASGKAGEAEARFRRHDGLYRWFLMRVVPIRNEHGAIVKWYGANTDIEDLKNTENALRCSEQLARRQTESLNRILDSLAHESSPDRVIEHVLRTLTAQLGAHSCSVWSKDNHTGMLSFEFSLVSSEFRTRTDVRFDGAVPANRVQEIWPGFDFGKPFVAVDIREGADFPWRSDLLSQGVISVAIIPMCVSGQMKGIVGIRFTERRALQPEEMQLAQTLANQAMLAMQLSRISTQSRQAAVLAERNRMARDIHDTLAQGFTGVIVQLEAADDATAQGLANEAGEHVRRAGVLARESLREARRSVRALRPQALEQQDLCEALDHLLRQMTAGTTLRTKFSVIGPSPMLPPGWEEHLLRICQEVLTNALRHAQASEFSAQLVFAPDQIGLEFKDNGRGFELSAKSEGFGLLGIRERVEGMGGQFTLDSVAGIGTAISIVLPLKKNSPSTLA